jgi:hypothetical protein
MQQEQILAFQVFVDHALGVDVNLASEASRCSPAKGKAQYRTTRKSRALTGADKILRTLPMLESFAGCWQPQTPTIFARIAPS